MNGGAAAAASEPRDGGGSCAARGLGRAARVGLGRRLADAAGGVLGGRPAGPAVFLAAAGRGILKK